MRHVAREISYSHSAETKAGRALIRSVENLTGRIKLIKQAQGYEQEVNAGRDFWDVMVERYRLSLELIAGSLDNIPKEGPVIVIANHPYGILDGLMLGHILSTVRGDFRILAHRIFRKAEDLNRIILPVSFDETKEAMKTNLETRREALRYLNDGGIIGIFPGGTVSTATKAMGQPMDPQWRGFSGKLIRKSGATVVPIYFDGRNSRLFQIASHLHVTLRTALFVNEFKRRVGESVRICVGEPLDHDRVHSFGDDPKAMMDFLRTETYALAPNPIDDLSYGFEFVDHYRRSA